MTAPVPQDAVDGAVAGARAYLRMVDAGEAAVLERLARTAFAVGEAFTGVSFVAREASDETGLAATWDALPPGVAQGVVMLVAHLFEDRTGARMPPAAVAALWRPWRRMRLDGRRP